MLQNIREGLKGTVVAGIVLFLFVVPLVLTGIGGSFLGSAAGTDAASVDGKGISESSLRRAVYQRKQQLLGRENVDPNADFLKDENLRGPVLEGLTQRAAIVVSATEGGMGVADTTVATSIRDVPDFQLDGKFDAQTYQRLISNFGYTPTSFKVQLVEDILVNQHTQGIEASAFSTEQELNVLVSLTQQKRSFFTIDIPKAVVSESVSVSTEDISSYYEENKSKFVEEEKLSVEYIELSVSEIALTVDVSDDEIKEQFDQEIASFKPNDEYEIAHILLEEKDTQAQNVEELTKKIAEGVDFAELVTAYSDDGGSKENAGNLGVLTLGVYPEAFEAAVLALDEGQVSGAVTTDAGVHFIKAISKKVDKAPTFEARQASIASALKIAAAEEIFSSSLEQFGELTFSSSNLQPAVDELKLKVKTTGFFTREGGVGVANNAEFREVAYSEEVLTKDYNSRVIEFSNSQAIVLRKAIHKPERTKDLKEIESEITETLTKQKIEEALKVLVASVIEKLEAGDSAEELAKSASYEHKVFDGVARSSSDASFQVNSKVFAMSLGEKAVAYDSVAARDGNQTVIALSSVVAGTRADIKDQQYKGLSSQLVNQNARFENLNYESQIVADADIDIK